MTTKLVLHIGLDKTGTTAIQKFMADNAGLFLREGILYPLTGRYPSYQHHGLFAHIATSPSTRRYAQIGTSWKGLLKALNAEIRKKRPSTVLLSSEILSQGVDMAALKELTSNFTITSIIFYLRRQDDYLASVYTQTVKSGGEFHQFDLANLPNADFLRLCTTWAEFVGDSQLHVRRYGRQFLKDSNLISDFLDCTLGRSLTDKMAVDRRNYNPRLTNDALEFKRLINLCCPISVSHLFIGPLLHASYEQDADSASDFSTNSLLRTEARSKIIQQYEATNREVARRFLEQSNGPLFDSDSMSTRSVANYAGLTNAKAAFLMSQLIDTFSDRGAAAPPIRPALARVLLRMLEMMSLNLLPDLELQNRESDTDGIRLRLSADAVSRGLAIKATIGNLLLAGTGAYQT